VADDEILAGLRDGIAAGRPIDGKPVEPVPAPITRGAVAEAEQVIGLPLPLPRIYLEVANGGVGPFAGIRGLPRDYTSDVEFMIGMYVDCRKPAHDLDEPPPPPPGVMFLRLRLGAVGTAGLPPPARPDVVVGRGRPVRPCPRRLAHRPAQQMLQAWPARNLAGDARSGQSIFGWSSIDLNCSILARRRVFSAHPRGRRCCARSIFGC
jgi:hypothetical protein